MPELPEIETLTRQLRDTVVSRTIVSVDCLQPKMLNLPAPEFAKWAMGPVIGTSRRGKSAILSEDDGSIWLHLGLRAEVRLVPAGEKEPKPVLTFHLDDGRELRMAKVFMGHASFVFPGDRQRRENELGAEPLSEGFTSTRLETILTGKPNASVKSVLMDQSLIAGIGNLYSDEILRWAGLNPRRKASTLSADDIARLYEAIFAVLQAAIAEGGDVDYTDLYGRGGRYEPKIHGREICGVCGSPISTIKLQGRTAYYCSHCNP